MSLKWNLLLVGTLCAAFSASSVAVLAQSSSQVIIKRDAVHLISPDQFRVPISLQSSRVVDMRARVEGIVQNVRVQPGAKVSAQEELIRIDSAQASKQLERAQAQLKAATLRRDLVKTETSAGKQPPLALDLAEAELAVAKADLELAQITMQDTSVRAPFAAQVTTVSAVQGSFVSQGELLLELRDTLEMSVQIPVDRSTVKAGDTLTVQLDNGTAEGTVKALLPLNSEWQALRQIIETAAIAVVTINNPNGQYQDGQTVYSAIVPRQPIIEVANSALKNSETGNRLVQVIRENMVRDIEVQLLGPVGQERSYIAGPFQENDELITESSQTLVDGTIVRPASAGAAATTEAEKKRDTAPGRPRPNANPNAF